MADNNGLSTEVIKHPLSVVAGFSLFFIIFFAPVVFSNYLLAPGDGISYFLPNFYSRTMLWDTSIWSGFPSVGDSQRMFWYPPAFILSLLPRTWNVFILSAYVLAASFTYGYIFSMTRSRLAAAVSGLTYSLSGFMIAHMGHAALVHTIAWLPLIVWSQSELARREKFSRLWFGIATLSVACAVLAGHPQMSTYVLLISGLFVLARGLTASIGTFRYYLTCGVTLLLGIGLSAIQILPTIELAPHTLRAALTFEDFVAYQLPLRQLPMIIFPFLYGGAPGSFYATPYFGAWPSSADGWGASELTGYVGLLPLLLAGVGFIYNRRKMTAWFWGGIALLSLILVLGESTALASITYHIPVLNKFRAPVRHFFAFTFAVSILGGLGVTSFKTGLVTMRRLLKTLLIGAALMTVCLVVLQLFREKVNELANQRLGQVISFNPFENPSLLVPLLIFISAALALIIWQRLRISRLRMALVFAVLIIDLSSFAWFYEWRYRSPYSEYLKAPAAFESYRTQIEQDHQRVLPVRGGLGRVSELPPDLTKLWDIPSASGYGPFVLTRLNRLLSMQPHGSIDNTWHEPANQSLDLLSVRYVLLPETDEDLPSQTDERGLRWSTRDFGYTLGQGCAPSTPLSAAIEMREQLRATRIGIVGTLACSVQVANGVEFAKVTTTNSSGHTEIHNLRAGEHFSEWSWDCSDVNPSVRHRRTTVFSSYHTERGDIRCAGHDYVAFLPLQSTQEIKRIDFRWTGPPATFALRKITMIDDERGVSVPVPPRSQSLVDESRWRLAGKIDHSNSGYGPTVSPEEVGVANVYENSRAFPRAWLVAQLMSVSDAEALNAVRTSRLADGTLVDLRRMALLEETPPVLHGSSVDFNGTARVRSLTDNILEVETNSPSAAFLITSDNYYPGWEATIDDQPMRIYRTNFLLRGVAVPAGQHLVQFKFRSRSFYVGSAITIVSLLLLTALCLRRPAILNHKPD